MWCLPHEIVLNIFSRLPTTSILQMKYVCRAWRNLAQEPLLADMHFQHGAENDPCLIFSDNSQLYHMETLNCGKCDLPVKKLHAPSTHKFHVVGSSAGLLCLCDTTNNSRLSIHNPFTRTYLELPEFESVRGGAVLFGFGFLPTMKEYKVVKISFSWHTSPPRMWRFHAHHEPQSDVKILTVGSPKWRSLGTVPYHFCREQPQLVNGKLHWLTRGSHYQPGCRLITFDLKDEQFGEVSKPPCAGWSSFSLAILGGCLSASCHDSETYEIWVLKNYDVMESWVKQYSITYRPRELEPDEGQDISLPGFVPRNRLLRVLCMLRTGEIILQYEGKVLVLYDEKNGTFKNLKFKGLPGYFDTTVHVSSLNSIETPKLMQQEEVDAASVRPVN